MRLWYHLLQYIQYYPLLWNSVIIVLLSFPAQFSSSLPNLSALSVPPCILLFTKPFWQSENYLQIYFLEFYTMSDLLNWHFISLSISLMISIFFPTSLTIFLLFLSLWDLSWFFYNFPIKILFLVQFGWELMELSLFLPMCYHSVTLSRFSTWCLASTSGTLFQLKGNGRDNCLCYLRSR